jgi:hypothetical protein
MALAAFLKAIFNLLLPFRNFAGKQLTSTDFVVGGQSQPTGKMLSSPELLNSFKAYLTHQ